MQKKASEMRHKFKFDLTKDKLKGNKSILKTVPPAARTWKAMPYLWGKTFTLSTVLKVRKETKAR